MAHYPLSIQCRVTLDGSFHFTTYGTLQKYTCYFTLSHVGFSYALVVQRLLLSLEDYRFHCKLIRARLLEITRTIWNRKG